MLALLAGCGSFPLSGGAYAPPGKTPDQIQLDNLTCKDKAYQAANTSERQAGAFVAGLTIVGAPLAIEAEKSFQRQVYKECLEARGYRVLPVKESSATTAAAQPASTAPTNSNEAAQLERLRDLRDKGLITESEYEQKRRAVLDRL